MSAINGFKKWVSSMLVVILVTTSILTPAYAMAANDNERDIAAYSSDLLHLLEEEYGPEKAPAMLELVQKLGLVGANGELMTYSVALNGKTYSWEEIKRIVADENADLTQIAEVDGEPITLAALKQIMDIEENLSWLLNNEGKDRANVTAEHLDSLESLLSQIDGDGGLRFVDENGRSMMEANALSTTANLDYADETIVSVTRLDEDKNVAFTETVSFTFQLNKSQTKPVSFAYELMDSTLHIKPRYNQVIKGTVVFAPGETTKQVTFTNLWAQRNIVQAYCVSGRGDFGGDLGSYQNFVWSSYARADYLHFYDFKNMDRMDFDSLETQMNYVPFTHSYEGGGYLSFTLGAGGGLYQSDQLNGVGIGACYYRADRAASMSDPSILKVDARAGEYTTGQIVPIQVLYSNMISREQPRMTGQPGLRLAGGGIAVPDVLPFADFAKPTHYSLAQPSLSLIGGYMAVVSKGMKADDLKVVAASEETVAKMEGPATSYLFEQVDTIPWDQAFTNSPAISISAARSDAFQSLTLDKASYSVGQTIKATLQLSNEHDEGDWLINGVTTPEAIANRVMISIGDRQNGLMSLSWKLGADGLPLSPPVLQGELKLTQSIYDQLKDGDSVANGKQLRAKIYYNRNTTPGALNASTPDEFGMLGDQWVGFQVVEPKYITSANLGITYPVSWPSGKPYVVNLIEANATKLDFTYPPDSTHADPDQFEWRSSDNQIAGMAKDGTIIPKQAGTVIFTLTAKNNGEAPEAVVHSETIQISSDGSAAVVVPSFANRTYVTQNSDATIIWSTNVMDRYKELAGSGGTPKAAHFKLELYDGFRVQADLAAQQPIRAWEAPVDAGLVNATSFVVPGSYMTSISGSHQPSYTVRISTTNPENEQSKLSALAYIVVQSEAAIVKLDKSIGQFVLDSVGTLPVAWTLDNFDPVNKGDFEFLVTRNGVPVPDSRIIFDQSSGQFSDGHSSASGGSYNLRIEPVTDSKRIKDVYAITLAVKNSMDSTWSYDSLYLQVYKSDALHIQIDGASVSSYTMSNIDRIKTMTSDQIIALKRKITLNNELGINNKDYEDLGEITDQIAWKSANPDNGAIYYRSNGFIDTIEQFANPSYQPKQKFMLAGLGDGSTRITATHAQTGMNTELDVTVQTLRNKLYLFQLYPKTETTFTYTNGDGIERSVTSNANGELALYEENGITSDVYVTSTFGGSTYTGVYSGDRLLTKEGNPAQLELYPVNILQLRQLSKVEIFFKKPDGKPYDGEVTYRGGVYKNGNYAEPTEIGGEGITKKLGDDGKLEIIFDTTDFYSRAAGEQNAADLSAKDKLEYVIEAQFENHAFNPSLLTLSGDTSPVDRIIVGEKIARLLENEEGQPTPVLVNQIVSDPVLGGKADIRDYNGKYGPSDTNPALELTTDILWWGEAGNAEAYAELETTSAQKPQGQSYQSFQYPFSDMWVTRHVQLLNKDTIWLGKAQSTSVLYKLYDKPGSFRKSFQRKSKPINMIGVPGVNKTDLRTSITKLKQDMNATSGSTSGPSNNDKVVLETLSLLGNVKMDVGPLSMRVYPTNDPMVYKMVMSSAIGGLASTKEGSDVEFMQSDNKFAPGAGDMYQMAMGQYVKDQKRQFSSINKDGHAGKNIPFSASGYYVGEIKYNVKTDAWEAIVHGGGFTAGGGFEYSWAWNIQAGVVPVTFSLTIGGGVEIGFRASVLFDELPNYPWANPELESVNDYLTSLRIIAYIEAFGGIGFDYSIIAFKIGVFGRITLENTSTWLNRDYLKNTDDRVLYGNKLTLESIVGVRVVLKFLFISIKHDFASLRYSHSWLSKNWNKIQDYWKNNAVQPLTAANAEVAIMSYLQSIGEEPMHVLSSQTMEDRSYLSDYDREWRQASSSAQRRLLAPLPSGPQVLQSNAYPYSNPQIAADGSLFAYLSDSDSSNVEDTAASWSIRNSQGDYEPRGAIAASDPLLDGYGDTGLQLAGEGNLIAAVWVRQKEKLSKEAGEELTGADILLMNNSAEVVVSIYDGAKWLTRQLTDNQNPDIAPVVSVANGKVIVAYRSAYTSNIANPLDFSASDNIVYTVYDAASGGWSDTETLYNGTNGTVMGMSVNLLTDGTAALVYTVNNGNVNHIPAEQYVAGTDNQIVYAVVDTNADATAQAASWRTKGVVKNLQVTNDTSSHENPQLTSAVFPDGEDRFVIAWHATSSADNGVAEDIRMLAINPDGEVYPDFVDSLNVVKAYSDININPNFVFAQLSQADKRLDRLSILWKEPRVDVSETGAVSRDVLKAVKLGMSGSELYLSGVMELGAMPEDTAIDTIAAYTDSSDGTEIKALLLGTTYTTDTELVGSITPKEQGEAGGEAIPVTVAKTVSAMYTASATYHNQFNSDYVAFHPGEVVAGFDLPIQFQVVNQGLTAIQAVDITIQGIKTSFDQLSIVPNNGQSLIAYHTVPSPIVDAPYEVEVTYMDGEKLSATGTLKLDVPDTGIANATVMQEEDGKRTLSIPVYNKNGTVLANRGRVVKLALYDSNSYADDARIGQIIDISDADDLSLIDQGAYVETVEVDVRAYLAKQGLQEIPDKGITLFMRSWVEDATGHTLTEFDETDNEASIVLDNLSVKYDEKQMLLVLEQSNKTSHTEINLTLQNANMAPIASGNVLLHLLDADGKVLETKYVATDAASLLGFGPEEKKSIRVSFSQRGESVQALFFIDNQDQLDATLSTVKLSGIPLEFDPKQASYTLRVSDVKQTRLSAVASNSEAVITVKDRDGEQIMSNQGFVALDQSLMLSASGDVNEWLIEVQPPSAAASKQTYQLTVTNTETARPQLEMTISGDKRADGTYKKAEVVLSPYVVDGFTIDKALYKVNDGGWQEATYDGSATKSLTAVTADGTYKVAAKVVLSSGLTYDLAPAVFQVKADVVPTPTPTTPVTTPVTTPESTPTTSTPAATPTPLSTPAPTPQSIFNTDIISWQELLEAFQQRLRSTSADDKEFPDTKRHWAKNMIHWFARLGVMNGYADGSFKPDKLVSRAEFSAMLVRLFRLKADGGDISEFRDVQGHWAERDIAILAKHSIVKGYQNGSFLPDTTITREDMATILMRLIDETMLPHNGDIPFHDEDRVSLYARRSIAMAVKAGIIQGYNGSLRPQAEATRAETAAMLWKLLLLHADMKQLMDKTQEL